MPAVTSTAGPLARRAAVLCVVTLGLTAGTHGATQTPAEQAAAAARAVIERDPGVADGHNQLALALARRARETSDPEHYREAERAITRALAIAPGNFESRKLRAWVLLGRHEFQQALDLAMSLNREMPDDLLVYGLLTDAHVQLGNYEDAERACQWMLDLRPGNVPAFTRAAHLRELFGDIEGALELMTKAYERTSPLEIEDRAWILTQIGQLELTAGRADVAERILDQALTLFPGYHYALAGLANVRTAQHRHADAAHLHERRYKAAPHPENLFELAEALDRAGRRQEASAAFAKFEALALPESDTWDNANRELVFYYANHARRPADALRIARLEASRRKDLYTLDALAWALYVSGQHGAARANAQRALDIGTKDPEVRARAARIMAAAP
jgi:tetratricopeptide (TPR) repeat protein